MKKIDTTNIAGSAKAPFIKDTHDHYKEAIQESTSEIIKGLLSGYTANDIIILYGCVVVDNIPGVSALGAGAIYYNGEIYQVDDEATITTTGSETLVWEIVTTYIAGDSTLQWSDGVIRDLHQIDRMTLVPGLTGTGLADYNGATVKPIYGIYKDSAGVETGNYLRTKIIEIGDWDMDATLAVSVAHGISDYTKIRNISAVVRPDAANGIVPLIRVDTTTAAATGGYVTGADATNIGLGRVIGGFFDSTDYNSTSFNRGFITIQYAV
jgi:hypothetical protein